MRTKSYLLLGFVFLFGLKSNTQEIPTDGLNLWLLSDTGVERDGDNVEYWEDQSGTDSHAEQYEPDMQPVYVANAVNGKPAIQFDGVDDYLSFFLIDILNDYTEMTIAIVTACTDENAATGSSQAERAAIFWNETASWGTVYISPYQKTISWRFGTTQVGNRQIYTRPVPIGDAFSLTITKKIEDTDYLYINGELADEKTGKLPALAAMQDEGNLGRGYNNNTFWPGMIAEVIVYLRALTDDEQETIESYLITKYGLTTSILEWALY